MKARITIGAIGSCLFLYFAINVVFRDLFPDLRDHQLVATHCKTFGKSIGGTRERARVFRPIRETHNVVVEDSSEGVLIFTRNPPDPSKPVARICLSHGELLPFDAAPDEALEILRDIGQSLNDGGLLDAADDKSEQDGQ